MYEGANVIGMQHPTQLLTQFPSTLTPHKVFCHLFLAQASILAEVNDLCTIRLLGVH